MTKYKASKVFQLELKEAAMDSFLQGFAYYKSQAKMFVSDKLVSRLRPSGLADPDPTPDSGEAGEPATATDPTMAIEGAEAGVPPPEAPRDSAPPGRRTRKALAE